MCADSVATVGSAFTARQEICEVGRRIYARAFVAANDGNISARLSADRILCTPTGVSKGFLKQDMLAICDMDGTQVSGPMKISSEIRMHLEAYKLRDDIAAVVHAHPPTATGFAVAGLDLT
jgi:L-fuculose-phosphate aldolase